MQADKDQRSYIFECGNLTDFKTTALLQMIIYTTASSMLNPRFIVYQIENCHNSIETMKTGVTFDAAKLCIASNGLLLHL